MENQPLFNTGAELYDSFRSLHPPADRIVFVAGLTAGQKVLDIACGSGRATMAAAELVGDTGKVTGIDIAEKLLEVAKEKAVKRSLSNVEYRLGDAGHLEFEDEYFDTVLCASSMYLFDNIPGIIREGYRVLKAGGMFVFSVLGKEMFQPVSGMIEASLSRYDAIEFPEPVFSITDSPEKCMDFLLAAGVHDTEIFVEQLSFTVENVDDCWRQVASSLLVRPRLAVLNKEEYQQVKQEVRNQLVERITDEGMEVAIPAIFCRIRKK